KLTDASVIGEHNVSVRFTRSPTPVDGPPGRAGGRRPPAASRPHPDVLARHAHGEATAQTITAQTIMVPAGAAHRSAKHVLATPSPARLPVTPAGVHATQQPGSR